MQEEKHLDCHSDLKSSKNDYESKAWPLLPTSYDWRYSNCDERRSGPCKLKVELDAVTDTLPTHITERLARIRALALEKYKEVRA